MSRSLRAAGYLKTSTSSIHSSPHIWISDDYLAETFRNFTHRHRRYGSNVPGPLEARKRAARRKNTSLAHHGTTTPPTIDPAVLLGGGPQHGWWQKPEPQISKHSPSVLPSWLFRPPDPTPPPTNIETGAGNLYEEESYTVASFEDQLCEKLGKSPTLKLVRHVIDSTQCNMRQNPGMAIAAFNHVLQAYKGDINSIQEMLHGFLTDPILNPPGSSLHVLLLEEVCKNPVSRKAWESNLFPALQGAIQLGLIGTEDLHLIIELLPKVHQTSGLAAIRGGEKLVSDYHRLLTAIADSKILRLSDLDYGVLRQLYQRIIVSTPSDNVINLLWRLRDFSGLTEVEVVAQLITIKLQHLVRENIEATDKFKSWILSLAQELRGPAILRTSQSLVASAIDGARPVSEIETWYHMFSSLNESNCTHIAIDRKSWDEAVNSPGRLRAQQNLLVLAWTLTNLNTNDTENSKLLASFGFEEQFGRAFTEETSTSSDGRLGNIVMILDSLPLTAKDKLYWHLQQFTKLDLTSMLKHKGFGQDIKSLTSNDLTKLNEEDFYRWAKQNANDKLVELASNSTTDLVAFKTMAQALIMKDKTTFKVINRILEHSLAIKLALPHWPKHVALQKEMYQGKPNLDSAQVTDLVHHLAISYAVSPAIGPRSAFRQVYRLYIFLHRYGAPILPLMSRALWHAGVTRYGKEGTSKTQLQWCLQKVREIEGPAVADMLLWSAGFRRSRTAELDGHGVSILIAKDSPAVRGQEEKPWAAYYEAAKQRSNLKIRKVKTTSVADIRG